MAGIFDFLTPDDPVKQQGLLAAAAAMLQGAGDPRKPFGFGDALGSGIGAYQQSLSQQQQLAQQQALRSLQIKAAQNELDDHDLSRQHAAGLQDVYANFGKDGGAAPAAAPATPFPKPQSAASLMGSLVSGQGLPSDQPAPEPQAPQGLAATDRNSIAQQHLLLAQALRAKGYGKEAQTEEEAAFKLQPKYSTDFRTATGADGQLHNYMLADDGSWKDTGLGVKPDVTEVDLGGTKQFVDKNSVKPGQVFKKSMSPDTSANTALGWARLNYDKSQADGTQDAVMDPLAVRMTAQQYLAGDTSALQNFGRGAQGSQNLNAVRAEIAKQANALGLTGSDIAARVAEFGGVKAGQRTAATRSAGIEIAANEVAQLAPLALDASAKVVRSGILPFGKAQVMFDSNTNDPNLRQFAMANNALANAYGQAMARGGVASVADKQHAQDLLGTAMDQPSYAASVAQLQQEIKAAQAAPKAVRKELSSGLTGRGGESAPAAAGGWSIQRVSP
jgi:hypothetical protein